MPKRDDTDFNAEWNFTQLYEKKIVIFKLKLNFNFCTFSVRLSIYLYFCFAKMFLVRTEIFSFGSDQMIGSWQSEC